MIDMWLLLAVRFIQSEYLLNYFFSFWFGYACFAYRCFKPVRDKWIIKVFYQECSFKTGIPFESIDVLEMVEGEKQS